MFLLKKLVAPLVFPVPIIVLLLVIGVALLWFTRRQNAGRILVTSGAVLLVALTYGAANPALRSLERTYPPAEPSVLAPVKWVVVLGGGTYSNPDVPLTARVSSATLSRLVEGIRVHRRTPGSRLILSGSAVFGTGSDAESMQAIALSLGVASDRIVVDDESPDTETQAVNVARIVKDDPCLVVTSGFHMHRALGLFEKAGVKAIAAPAHYIVQSNHGFSPGDLYPDPRGLVIAQVTENEYLGMAWAWLRGRI